MYPDEELMDLDVLTEVFDTSASELKDIIKDNKIKHFYSPNGDIVLARTQVEELYHHFPNAPDILWAE